MKFLRREALGILAMGFSASLIACSGTSCVSNQCNTVVPAKSTWSNAKTHWTPRAQGQQLGIFAGVGVGEKINLFNNCGIYGVLDFVALYEQTVRPNHVSSYFGGRNGLITIGTGSGSKMVDSLNSAAAPTYPYSYIATSPNVDIRSSDLGLSSTEYTATLCLQPKIRNFVFQPDFYVGWDGLVTGLFSRLRVPLTWSRWDIGLITAVEDPRLNTNQLTNNLNFATAVGFLPYGMLDNAVGNFDNGVGWQTLHTFPLVSAYDSISSLNVIPQTYYQSDVVPTDPLATQNSMFPALTTGKMCGRISDFRPADIIFDTGYNFVRSERGMLGLALHVVFPAGTKHDAACIFTPRIGYGRWQIGGMLNAQYTFWNCNTHSLSWYLYATVTSARPTTERRLLGLKANNTYQFNHYLLLKKYNNSSITLEGLERAANLLFQPIKLSSFINADAAVWLQYRNYGFDFSVGYNLVARQEEGTIVGGKTMRVSEQALIPVDNATFGDSMYSYIIKGDTPLYLINTFPPVSLASQQASPHGYSKLDSNINTLGTLIPTGSVAPATGQTLNEATLAQIQAAAFTGADVVADPALHDRMITNAFFAYVGYTWLNMCPLQAFVGAGFQYEVGHNNAAMNMWAGYVKGGFAF